MSDTLREALCPKCAEIAASHCDELESQWYGAGHHQAAQAANTIAHDIRSRAALAESGREGWVEIADRNRSDSVVAMGQCVPRRKAMNPETSKVVELLDGLLDCDAALTVEISALLAKLRSGKLVVVRPDPNGKRALWIADDKAMLGREQQ